MSAGEAGGGGGVRGRPGNPGRKGRKRAPDPSGRWVRGGPGRSRPGEPPFAGSESGVSLGGEEEGFKKKKYIYKDK